MARNPILPSGTAGLDIRVNYDAFYDAIGTVTKLNVDGVTIEPLNFTGFQHIEVQVRANAGDVNPLVTFNDTLGTLIFTQPLTVGKFQFQVPYALVNTLGSGFAGVYDLFLTDSLGHRKKWTAGAFYVAPRGSVI